VFFLDVSGGLRFEYSFKRALPLKADEVLWKNIAPAELELFHNSDQELCYYGGSSSPLQAEGYSASVIKIILLSFLFSFALAVKAHGGACGCSSFHGTGLAGPIITIPAYNMAKGTTAISFSVNFLDRGRLDASQTARIIAGHSHDGGAHHADDNYGSLMQTLAVSHGLTDRLSLSAVIPFVESFAFREVTGDGIANQGNSIGFGDMTLMGKYKFYDKYKFQSALIAGMKFPTGATNVQADNNERFEATNQPGSGSFDPLLGLALSKQFEKFGLDSNFLYKFSTRGAQDSVIGDVASYNVAVSYAVNHGHEDEFHHHHLEGTKGLLETIFPQHILGQHLAWDLIMEINTLWQEAPILNGAVNANHGGTIVYLSPGLRMVLNDTLVYNLSIGFPVVQALNGIQGGNDLQLSFSMAMSL